MRVRFAEYIFLLPFVFFIASCDKYLPEDRDTLEVDAIFTNTKYEPTLGRHEIFSNNFHPDGSSLPIEFKIVNLTKFDGSQANELTKIYPVKVWKKPYLGNEKSLEEIEAKREIENRPIFEIGKYNGRIRMWPNASSEKILTQPDSGYLFDVEVSSSGGRKYFRQLELRPRKERPFEPSNQNQTTGQIVTPYVSGYISPEVKGNITGKDLRSGDMRVYFHKLEDDPHDGKTLTFRFLDSLMNPIDPNNFNMKEKDWEKVIHGFNMEKTDEYVRYSVAYPIPLIEFPTEYTNPGGERARARFQYNRLGFGQVYEEASIGIDFSIYEPGDWEIYFVFPNEHPRFKDE